MTTKQQWRNALPSRMQGMRIVALPHEEINMSFLLWEHNRITLNRIKNPTHSYFDRPDEESLMINRQRRIQLRDRIRENAPDGIAN